MELAGIIASRPYWNCHCDCGRMIRARHDQLLCGKTKSCGCLKVKHGHRSQSPSPTYHSWASMKSRCLNPLATDYNLYGGRGVKVCDRWLDFNLFLEDMGERPEGKTIDRYPDANGNYEPGNCRWATAGEQNSNRRKYCLNKSKASSRTMGRSSRTDGNARDTTRSND